MATIPALQDTMIKLNIPSSKCFPQWLAEELAYLKNQKQDPPEETLEMEYYSRLVAYHHIEYVIFFRCHINILLTLCIEIISAR